MNDYIIIVAMTKNNIIGVNGKLPWHYPEDLKQFKNKTLNSTIIMGRFTWESLPQKPLPHRRNIVITRHNIQGVECFPNIKLALASINTITWFIGGKKIFEEAIEFCNIIDVTYVPDIISEGILFPEINPSVWGAKIISNKLLKFVKYYRIK
jgi:dihydrofolate reductase